MPIANHEPTHCSRVRVATLAQSGIPLYLIAEMMDLDEDTINKYYSKELKTSKADMIARIGETVARQALEGSEKSQALYLKTQGAQYGWVEKQVVENVGNSETAELKARIAELEKASEKDY